jgi:hypothetical protein
MHFIVVGVALIILYTAIFMLSSVAVALDMNFLIPFILSAIFWVAAGYNFKDALTRVEKTGYRNSGWERSGAFFRALCFLAITTPFFKPDAWPAPWAYFVFFGLLVPVSAGVFEYFDERTKKTPGQEIQN